MAFDLPLPLPSATPTVPAPLPSLPAVLGISGGQPGQQQTQAPQAAPATNARHLVTAPPVSTSTAPASAAAAVAQASDGPLQTQQQVAQSGAAATHDQLPPSSGATPAAPGGGPQLPEAGVLAGAFAVALLLLILRLAPLQASRGRRVALAINPMTEPALDAAFCLCQSMLPAGAEVRRHGDALSVRASRADRDELDQALAAIARRGLRVGLQLSWTSEAAPAAEQLVPA